MTHFIIYVKQAPLLNVYVLFLCMYTIYILIILKKCQYRYRYRTEIEILISNHHYFQ